MTQQPDEKRVNLRTTQVVAGSLASVTSAVAASSLGVGGTLVGAGVGSVVATVGSAVYEHYLDRTRRQVRSVVLRRPGQNGRPADRWPDATVPGAGGATQPTSEPPTAVLPPVPPVPPSSPAAPASWPAPPGEPPAAGAATDSQPTWAWLRSRRLALGVSAVAAFGIGLGAITGFEKVSGQPLSGQTNGDGATTTISRLVGGGSTTKQRATEPAATTSPTPTTSAEPSPTPSDQSTTTPTPTPQATEPTLTPTPTTQPTEPLPTPTVPAG